MDGVDPSKSTPQQSRVHHKEGDHFAVDHSTEKKVTFTEATETFSCPSYHPNVHGSTDSDVFVKPCQLSLSSLFAFFRSSLGR
eukprot:m.56247 g.56247  ORF g.56247 m.56247 type:complete len:83 (+) comp9294_c0_seq4:3268-3516(+)